MGFKTFPLFLFKIKIMKKIVITFFISIVLLSSCYHERTNEAEIRTIKKEFKDCKIWQNSNSMWKFYVIDANDSLYYVELMSNDSTKITHIETIQKIK